MCNCSIRQVPQFGFQNTEVYVSSYRQVLTQVETGMPLLGTHLSQMIGQCKQDLQHVWEFFSCTRWTGDSNFYSIDEINLAAAFFSLFYYSVETYYYFVKTPDAKPLHFWVHYVLYKRWCICFSLSFLEDWGRRWVKCTTMNISET